MPYNIPATHATQASVYYLIDSSSSMREELDGSPKIEHVNRAIAEVLGKMVQRSTKGSTVSPRYRLAIITYSDQPYDLLGGSQTIKEVVQRGYPRFTADGTTDTAAAFMVARNLLKQDLPNLQQGHPAPMVCHLTDGMFTGSDPEPIAQEIMQMSNDDGNVLVENIFVDYDLTRKSISDTRAWPGILD